MDLKRANPFQPAPTMAEKSSRLGLFASLAFGRFISLYRKFDPNQPRDDHGRWIDSGERDNIVTGAVVARRYRTGNPRIDEVTAQLERIVQDIMDQAGPGSGAKYGSRIHGYFAEAVRAANIPGIGTTGVESSFFEGEPASYGTDGSVRTDVILRTGDGPSDPIIAIWDLKTGMAYLPPSRVDDLRKELHVGEEVPVIELQSIRGISVKEFRTVSNFLGGRCPSPMNLAKPRLSFTN